MSASENKSGLFNKIADGIDDCFNNPAVHTAGLALNSLAMGATLGNPMLTTVFGGLAALSGAGLLMNIVKEPQPVAILARNPKGP